MAEAMMCSVDGCCKAARARGWCRAHYERWRVHGDPLGGGTFDGEPLAFLENTAIPFDGDECLIWPYWTGGDGRGRIWLDGKNHLVHRIVCEARHGPPPTPKHEAAHLCGNGHDGCVNRKHLYWGTPKENCADRLLHGTHTRGERNGIAKLTEAQVLEIRASTKLRRELTKEYGIARSTVYMIKARKIWAWLEDKK